MMMMRNSNWQLAIPFSDMLTIEVVFIVPLGARNSPNSMADKPFRA